MDNLTVESFITVGLAAWKVFTFFWPVVLAGAIGLILMAREERRTAEVAHD